MNYSYGGKNKNKTISNQKFPFYFKNFLFYLSKYLLIFLFKKNDFTPCGVTEILVFLHFETYNHFTL